MERFLSAASWTVVSTFSAFTCSAFPLTFRVGPEVAFSGLGLFNLLPYRCSGGLALPFQSMVRLIVIRLFGGLLITLCHPLLVN